MKNKKKRHSGKKVKTINYYLTSRGFGSEIIQLINIISYGICNNIKINIISEKWNSCFQKGWNDYFSDSQFFKQSKPTKTKDTLNDIQFSIKYIKYIYVVNNFKTDGYNKIEKGLSKYILPTINHFFYCVINSIKKINEIEISGAIGTNLNIKAKEVWMQNIAWGNIDKKIEVNHKSNNYHSLSDLHHYIAQTLFKELNSKSQAYIKEKTKDILNNKGLLSVQIRRGDKLREEAKYIPTEQYVKAIEKHWNNKSTIFISTDDHSVIDEIKNLRPEWDIISFTSNQASGHDQYSFNKKDKSLIYKETLTLITEILIHSKSKVYIGTATSNITRLVALLRNKKESTFSLDKININMYDNLITLL